MSEIMNRLAIKGIGIQKDFLIGSEKLKVLKGINLEVHQGEFVSIMGPSGCGKSTLLYILGGLDSPSFGSVSIDGKNISEMDDKKKSEMRCKDVGFIFQFYNLVQNLTVEENILLPLVIGGKKASSYSSKLSDVIEFVGLQDRRKHTPRELSGGQQQRVAIARSIIIEPKILFADEAIGNLDSKAGNEVMKLFRNINNEKGTTIIQVTHSDEAAAYGTRIIHMRDGLIMQ